MKFDWNIAWTYMERNLPKFTEHVYETYETNHLWKYSGEYTWELLGLFCCKMVGI